MAVFNEDTRVKIPATIQFLRLNIRHIEPDMADMKQMGILYFIATRSVLS